MRYQTIFKAAVILILMACVLSLAGCEALRFAPTESQKQAAFSTHLMARNVEATGTQPGSETAQKLVTGTGAAVTFMGPPANLDLDDFDTTVNQAQADAAQRPTMDQIGDAVEGGLSLAAELAILFGVGGVGFGGKKVVDWISLARDKSKAMKEIITANELFKDAIKTTSTSSPEIMKQFKDAQDSVQSVSTKQIVIGTKEIC